MGNFQTSCTTCTCTKLGASQQLVSDQLDHDNTLDIERNITDDFEAGLKAFKDRKITPNPFMSTEISLHSTKKDSKPIPIMESVIEGRTNTLKDSLYSQVSSTHSQTRGYRQDHIYSTLDFIPIIEKNWRNFFKPTLEILRQEVSVVKLIKSKHNQNLSKIKKLNSIAEKQDQICLRIMKFFLKDAAPLQLDHPNIARVCQIYQHESECVFLMEEMQISLKQFIVLRRKNMRNKSQGIEQYGEQIKAIFCQVLKALAFLHGRNLCHLRLSLQHIMLAKRKFNSPGDIIAKLIGLGEAEQKIENSLLNSQSEIPDKLEQQQRDIQDLGLLLFRAITGLCQTKQQLSLQQSSIKSLKEHWKNIWSAKQTQQIEDKHCYDLIFKMLEPDTDKRLSARQCLQHPWFLSQSLFVDGENNDSIARLMKLRKKDTSFVYLLKSISLYHNITQQQIHEYSRLFSDIDTDHNGLIDFNELSNFLKLYCFQEQEESVITQFCLDLMLQINVNESGQIIFHEFLYQICWHQFWNQQSLSKVFMLLDYRKRGYLLMSDLDLLTRYHERQEKLLQLEETNPKISKSDFITFCLQAASDR